MRGPQGRRGSLDGVGRESMMDWTIVGGWEYKGRPGAGFVEWVPPVAKVLILLQKGQISGLCFY